MILGFCVSGSTVAVYTGDVSSSPTYNIFSLNNFFMYQYYVHGEVDKHWTSGYQAKKMLGDILQRKYTRIGFSVRNIAKQAVACHTFMVSWSWAASNGGIFVCSLWVV